MKPASVAWAQLSIALLLALATGCAESVNNSGRKTPEARWNDPSDNASDGKPDRTATDNDSTCLEDCSQYESPPCYKSVCNAVAGRCESVPADGEPCDDGLFCTAADSCLAGACFGGSGDACADTDLPVCHVARCDEPTDSCVPEGLANGAPCSSDNLCEVDGACTFGSDGLVACIGQPRDCTFSAGKDDCNDVACNPNTGSCEPIPVADGSWCADALDRCLLNTTCQSGICTSNSKRDCGHLSQGCDDGLCNPNTGSCVTQPVPAGGECAAAADECNAGICDASGSCLPVPLADGTACKKLCNTGATCQAGECAGGTEVDGCNGQSKLDLGGVHNCSIQDDGALWCWGYNGDSQLGLGDQTDRNTPTQVGTNADWSTIALGYSHSCGRKDNGTLWCWGYNKYGQLGLGDQTDRNTPTQVGTDADWSAIALGDNHSCGIKDNGTLWCWGYNDVGGLGLGDQTDRNTPTQVGTDADWSIIGLGGYHSCGLKAGGSLWCWGYNDFGQLGLGDWTSHTTPTQVGTSIDWSTIILGGYHSCGIKDDGSALCWGYNGYGQLGLGDSGDGTERDTPTQVGTGADWSALTLGTYHSCGIKNDGSALCWGYNEYGQLGLSDSGDGTERDTPTQVGTDANWSAIALGAVHSCGPKSDGSLWCWGYNEFGQLGLGDSGTGTDRSTPTQVGTGTDWL